MRQRYPIMRAILQRSPAQSLHSILVLLHSQQRYRGSMVYSPRVTQSPLQQVIKSPASASLLTTAMLPLLTYKQISLTSGLQDILTPQYFHLAPLMALLLLPSTVTK